MRESLGAVELALSAPAAADPSSWTQRVHVALVELSADLRLHVRLTEGPGGLYGEVLSTAPRLTEAASRLTEEHTTIRELLDDLVVRAEKATTLEDITVIRDLGTDLLTMLMRHRQRGADLVYEAYEFDIGGDT